MAAILGGVGLVSGIAFSLLFSFAESGRVILNLSLGRAALWGILGSAAFPLLTGRQDQVFIMCPIGAAVSMAVIAIARKAEIRTSRQPKRLRDAFFACVIRIVRDAVNPAAEPSSL
jgi:hypothetical protein